ncbi:hypothetical protein QJQ45_000175 [Haematococcus lacustris]|nr:hypothetical protein QJQ45_000175 [Haematococcus lacustris]
MEATESILGVKAKIEGLEAKIEGLEEKIEGLEQSCPANERPAGLAIELEQLRQWRNLLQEELVEWCKCRNILLTKDVTPSSTPSEVKTVLVVIPAMLHGNDIKRFRFTFHGEESFEVRSADSEVHAQYSTLHASDEWL